MCSWERRHIASMSVRNYGKTAKPALVWGFVVWSGGRKSNPRF
jgi:hypothetical protein